MLIPEKWLGRLLFVPEGVRDWPEASDLRAFLLNLYDVDFTGWTVEPGRERRPWIGNYRDVGDVDFNRGTEEFVATAFEFDLVARKLRDTGVPGQPIRVDPIPEFQTDPHFGRMAKARLHGTL
jgi:hypothetical protein